MSDTTTAPAAGATPAPAAPLPIEQAPAPPAAPQSQPGHRNIDPASLSVSAAARLMRQARTQAAQQAAQAPAGAPGAPAAAAAPGVPQTAPAGAQAAPAAPASPLDPPPEVLAALDAGETPAAPAAETPPPPAESRHRVKVNGEEIEVTLAEALAGYSRQQDYQRKTAQLSERERVAEQIVAQAAQERQRAALRLDQVLSEVSTLLVPEADLDRLLETDPVAYQRELRRRGKVTEAINERMRLAELDRAEQMAQLRQFTAAESQKLLEARPEWRDPDTMRRVQTELRDYALSAGFNHQDVNNVRDHRMLLILEKAAKYDRLMARKPQPAAQPANGAAQPATVPPGAAPASPRTTATAAVRAAEATFDEKPSLKNAMSMLRARRTGEQPRR